MSFCANCGAQLEADARFCPRCGARQPLVAGDGITRDFANSVAICLRKYAEFRGRAPRAEFWYFVLFYFIVYLAAGFIGLAVGGVHGLRGLEGLAWVVLLLPSVSVQVRRLHDIDRTGWWWWLWLIPVIGTIVLLVWACMPGTPGENRFGPPEGSV